jgi:hypothetical protein
MAVAYLNATTCGRLEQATDFCSRYSSSGDVCQAILILLCQGPKWGGFGAWEMMVDGRQVLGGGVTVTMSSGRRGPDASNRVGGG